MADSRSGRSWLRANWGELSQIQTDQQAREAYPSLEQPVPADALLIELPAVDQLATPPMTFFEATRNRQSRRRWSDEPLTLDELALLLWATQGVRSVAGSGAATLRTVPSGGSRHTFETYLAVGRVDGLGPGLYRVLRRAVYFARRYLALEHKLWQITLDAEIMEAAGAACLGQRTVRRCAAAFFWSSVPYRAEWRYAVAAHKMIAIDAGHVCQNLYLACEALHLGCCAIGAYDQQLADTLIGADGDDELAVYAAAVGRL